MRVLHVSDRLTDRGGAYWHLLGVIAHQTREHDVHLAVGRADPGVAVDCAVTVLSGLDARTRRRVELGRFVRELRPDVVHVHNVMNPEALEQAGAIEGEDRGVARVITVQDHRLFCPGKGKFTEEGEVCVEHMSAELCTKCFSDDAYYREILSLTEERFASLERFRVVVLSEYMKRELGVPDAHVIPPFVHGLDTDVVSDGSPCVLFAGRLVETKGVVDAVAAWQLSGVELPLVLAGTGTLRDELEGVELLGWVPHERMAALYRRAAVVVMPSRWQEPFGIVGLEAMALGTPVAAWESGGIPEWHPGPLAPWGDVDALALEIRRAVGRQVTPRAGFERRALMDRLDAVYRTPPT